MAKLQPVHARFLKRNAVKYYLGALQALKGNVPGVRVRVQALRCVRHRVTPEGLRPYASKVLMRCLTLLITLCLTALGCSHHAHRVRDARQAYFANDLATASALLLEAEQSNKRERDCLVLDRAIVALADGQPDTAERLLRDVRDHFDHLEQADIVESGLSWFSDDTKVAYSGEDYEDVMIRAMLAISNLMYDGSDAVAYCLQVDQKQREIAERLAKEKESPVVDAATGVAVGAYIRGVVHEESHINYDEAERAFSLAASLEPQFSLAQFDLQRVQGGVHSTSGNGVVYVFAFVGRGPYKEETIAEVTSDALLAADRLLSATGDRTLPPTIAPVRIPAIVVPANAVESVAVDVDEQPVALTQTVTNVAKLALAQHERERSKIIARAVARRVLKKAAVYSAKEALDVEDNPSNFLFDAMGVLWEATENADTRCWALLPESIQVLRLELPAGAHRISLRPARRGQPIGLAHSIDVEVLDGRNTYVLGSFPTQQLVGKLLTSEPVRVPMVIPCPVESRQAFRLAAEPSENGPFMIR